VQILAAPPRIEDSELIQGEHVTRLLEILRGQFDFVVLDVSRNWNDASVRALDLADQILVVTSLDVPTLHHARKHMELLRRLGHPTEKIHAVVNRHSAADSVTDKDLTRFLGRPSSAAIPNDYANTVESVNQGKPLGEVAPRAALTEAFRNLAEQVHVWCGLTTSPDTRAPKLTDRLRRIFEK
jgi:pilus assembly protein CpaE